MRHYLFIVLLSLVPFTFVSCGDDEPIDGTTTETTKNSISGFWYASVENTVYSLYLDNEGSAILNIYTWENKEWHEVEKKAAYTYNTTTGEFVFRLDDSNVMQSGTMVKTGNNLSIKSGEEVIMFTKYSGAKSDLENIFNDVEDNYLDNTPGDITVEEEYWTTEEDCERFLAAVYFSARDYIRYQLYIEDYLLNYKQRYGEHHPIYPGDSNIITLWQKGYETVNRANLIIDKTNELPEGEKYSQQAKAIRAFIYYNMAMLWGNIPYMTEVITTDADLYSKAPQTTAQKIYPQLINELNTLIFNNETAKYLFTSEAVAVLKHEIMLTLEHSCTAILTYPSEDIFHFEPLDNSYMDQFMMLLGTETPIYSRTYYELLCNEQTTDSETIVSAWQGWGEHKYGYWAMLKRVGKAQQMAKLFDHELLLPIPKREIAMNPNLIQNPGYNDIQN